MSSPVRIAIRVRPRSDRTEVGGSHDGSLVVRVREPAVDGRANEAAMRALAAALGVPRSALLLVSGGRARTKVVEVAGADPALPRVVEGLKRG
jgi:uncharacterized protein YggU (UPF0235/DUF167 family)